MNLLTMEINYQGFADAYREPTNKIPHFAFSVVEYNNDYFRYFVPKIRWQENSAHLIKRFERNPSCMRTIGHVTETYARSIWKVKQQMESPTFDYSNKSAVEKIFDRIVEAGVRLCVYGMPIVIMETGTGNLSARVQLVIERYARLHKNVNLIEATNVLLQHPALTYSQKYRLALLDAAVRIKSTPSSRSKFIRQIIQDFGWINFGYKGPELSEEDVMREIKEIAQHPLNQLLSMRKEIKIYPTRVRSAQHALFARLKMNAHDQALCKAAALGNYLKLYRKDLLFVINSLIYCILEPRKGSFTHEELGYLALSEARALIHSGRVNISRKELRERKRYSLHFSETQKIVTGKNARMFVKKHFEKNEVDTDLRVLEGQTASLGDGRLVEGIVKIVINVSDISKVQPGDIMVSTATVPPMLPAMKCAAAIVTDVGGITSHAAIVARELNKPCVIGTKHATKVFKDGDKILVDVRHGYVRKV
ncbi:MAG: Phosphoenolpyruvate synthase/pyruvate phosphate dikinase [Candidatus Magasanikbacteria bacterium GW2011_GWC2_45_8]|uniref:Phosphoenolpyruvate synthase/pyruvate phosphate dikinase n=1 Tax=Candidatus Magasanikbacteria bacterium GW2011_GWC2_45_8 TaxID=1619050 RepID=A0A0G1QV70_9BACT|nr:MAG: Phosphoenolpyruvate synthase/pyruvate phosphate dikinase [Candidatus Magasanikbacteria bacterium GW2011_GWC2_45_8]